MNKVFIWLQRRGRVVGTMRVLTVRGRKTGRRQTTPVSPLPVNGHDYVTGYGQSDWVKNARAAGEGTLAKGKQQRRVKLVELPEHERGPVLREFPAKVPHGVDMYLRYGLVAGPTPEDFEAAAPTVTVFRIEPL
ncbi:deazaflavin-dependent nitroreductase [Actinopolymorpha sp. B11F2]|uniref:deazaflavin-dependent nitroreductase n=1 Tax=Actinopolymorpha sp. B11F2 TaxID=3160862 RepID=UPI0032E3FE76